MDRVVEICFSSPDLARCSMPWLLLRPRFMLIDVDVALLRVAAALCVHYHPSSLYLLYWRAFVLLWFIAAIFGFEYAGEAHETHMEEPTSVHTGCDASGSIGPPQSHL